MNQIAQNKNNFGDNSLNMQSNSGSRVLRPIKRPGQGKIGDYANLEKLNGNFDLLDAMDMQVNGWTEDTIDKHDWTTWPAWLVREIGHTDNRDLMYHINCDCGSCEPAYDEMRDEAYCYNCGFIAGQGEVVSKVEEYYEDWAYEGERWKEEFQDLDDDATEYHDWRDYRPIWTERPAPRKPRKSNFGVGGIHILWVYSNEEITTEDPITGETITETVKVQLKVATGDDSWEAINPVTGKLDTPDGLLLGSRPTGRCGRTGCQGSGILRSPQRNLHGRQQPRPARQLSRMSSPVQQDDEEGGTATGPRRLMPKFERKYHTGPRH